MWREMGMKRMGVEWEEWGNGGKKKRQEKGNGRQGKKEERKSEGEERSGSEFRKE